MFGGYCEPEKKMRESDLDGWGMPITYSNAGGIESPKFSRDALMSAMETSFYEPKMRTIQDYQTDKYDRAIRAMSKEELFHREVENVYKRVMKGVPRYEGGTVTKMNTPYGDRSYFVGADMAAGGDHSVMYVRQMNPNGTVEIGYRDEPRVDEEKDVEPVERPSNSNRAIRNMFMRKRKENNLTAHQVIN